MVSSGDSTAITAARPVLESFLGSYRDAFSAVSEALVPAAAAANAIIRDVGQSAAEGVAAAAQVALAPSLVTVDAIAERREQWHARWARAGWLSEKADVDDMVTLAISAGNAAKLSRRNIARRSVVAPDGWRVLASRLGAAGIDYAVSGLVATREDRATAVAGNPVIYVEDPSRAVEELRLQETTPGGGVLLIAPVSDELARAEVDGGIRFVSWVQGALDAFAGSGREPDKAEDALRHRLAVSA
ncbi:hypothetical protein [Okibacterium endophyticum]